jgi:acetolactate synthase-1/2/3 large subunit
MAAGVLGYGDELNMGIIGMHGSKTANLAVDNADLVLAIGTRFSDRVALNPQKFARRARIVHIDIDPSEIGKNVPADVSIIGDVKEVLTELLPMVENTNHTDWINQIKEWRKKDYCPKDDDSVLKPHQVMSAICDAAGEDAVFITDVGQHQMWAAQYIRHLKTRSFLTSGGLGTMGYGYGAALGAAVADKENRPIIHITGDGSFHMNMNEACTAVSYNLPVITVIMNNSVLGMVRQWQKTFYGKRFSSSEPERKTNYKAVAEGFGLTGFRCENLAEFKDAMDKALKLGGPVWIECVIDREEAVLPMIPAGGSVDDIIIN